MTIKELKKELNLSNADIAKCFDMSYGAYANSTAKERYENALLSFYKLTKKGWEKNKRKNLISDNQTIKHEPKPLIIHGVSSSLIVNIKSFGGFIDKLCETDYTKRTKQYKYKNNWYGFTELKKIYKAEFL